MENLPQLSYLFGAWEALIVTLDTHPLGAFVFLMLTALICYAAATIWRK